MTTTFSTDDKRMIIRMQCARHSEVGGTFEPSLAVMGRLYSNSTQLRTALDSLPDGELDDVLHGLARIERAETDRRERQRSIDELDEERQRRDAPLSADEQATIDADLDHARALAERQNSTESRLGRIEALLERIAVGLETR